MGAPARNPASEGTFCSPSRVCGAGYLYPTTLGRDHRLAPQRRRAVHDANIGPCGRGVVPGGSKELKLRMVDEGPGGGGEELVGASLARR